MFTQRTLQLMHAQLQSSALLMAVYVCLLTGRQGLMPCWRCKHSMRNRSARQTSHISQNASMCGITVPGAAHRCEVAVRVGQAFQADGELHIARAHNVLDLELLQDGGRRSKDIT